jgi:EAL and modified HD-GYP domain-containing signal transduction protein
MKYLIARQPVFDSNEAVIAYELLFGFEVDQLILNSELQGELPDDLRNSLFGSPDSDDTKTKDVYVEISPQLMLGNELSHLSSNSVILFLKNQFVLDDRYVAALNHLKQEGFRIALGAYATEDQYVQLAELADFLIADFKTIGQAKQNTIPIWCSSYRMKSIARNLETREAFSLAKKLNYDCFHGQFFYKPEYVEKNDIPAFKVNYMRLLQEINQGEISFDKLDNIIKQDVSLTFKLLNYINSAAFGLRSEIESVKHALNMLGVKLVKKWATMVTIASIGKDVPEEALVTSVLRGRFLEELGKKSGHINRVDDFFFMGIFSMIDLFFSRPIDEVLEEIPINSDIKEAILRNEGQLSDFLPAVISYETGDWAPLNERAATIGIDIEEIPELYFNALDWTQNLVIRA